jgi:transcriptional regulator with GAF, ATPase, and Fis domain
MDGPVRNERHPVIPMDENRLDRTSWRNWIMLAGVALLTTIGLAVSVAPTLFNETIPVWSWVKTDVMLLASLVVLVSLFVTYLTQQQRHVARMRDKIREMKIEAEESALKNSSRLHALHNVSHFVGTELDRQGVFDCITRTCTEVFDSHWSSLALYDKQADDLEVQSMHGSVGIEKMLGVLQPIGKGIAKWVASERQPLRLSPSTNLEKYLGSGYHSCPITAAMAAPIILGDELIGVISVSRHNSDLEFVDDDLRALQVFAENAGAFIRNAERIEILISRIKYFQKEVSLSQ